MPRRMDDGGEKANDVSQPVAEHPNELWSQGQQAAHATLVDMAQTFFEVDWADKGKGLKPRLDPLVVGPTGMGKSHLVRAVAKSLNIPMLRLSYNEWLLNGARETPATLTRVHYFINSATRGIIHIDEMDKFRTGHRTEWATAVHGEVFQLLDRSLEQPTRGVTWTPDIQAKLKQSILIIGSGTWQALWSKSTRPKIGFLDRGDSDKTSIATEIARSELVPTELLRRFCSELVVMPPATEADYRHGAAMYGLDALAIELGETLDYQDACTRGLGARWLEEVFARLLRVARRQGKMMRPVPGPTELEPTIDMLDLAEDDIPF